MADLARTRDCPQQRLSTKNEPLLIFKILIRFPVACFLFTLCFLLAAAAATLSLHLLGEDVFAFDFEQFPLVLNQESARRRELSWRSRNEYEGHLTRIIISRSMPWWPRGYAFDHVEMMYQNEDNILTTEHMKTMKEIEDRLYYGKNYSQAFCLLEYDQTCRKPLSLLRFFDGSHRSIDRAFDDPGFSDITNVLNKANYYNETKEDLWLLVGEDSKISPAGVQAKIIRTRIPIGGPLTYFDGRAAEKPRYIQFLRDHLKPEVETIRTNYTKGMTINYFSEMLFRLDLNDQAFLDLRLAIGSQVFILIYIWIHTESLWITFWATFSIFTSFLTVNLFYRFALGYSYFGFFHLLSIFIILGIGADDIFIFYDTWRLNCNKSFPSDAHRLSATYVRASGSMLATSLTTMAAFFVSGASPLLAVSTFGIFSGLLVFVNYISVITFFPTVVVVYTFRVLPLLRCIAGCITGRKWKNKDGFNAHDNPGFEECTQNGSTSANNLPTVIFQNQLSLEDSESAMIANGTLPNFQNQHTEPPLTDTELQSTDINLPLSTSNVQPQFQDWEPQITDTPPLSEPTVTNTQPPVAEIQIQTNFHQPSDTSVIDAQPLSDPQCKGAQQQSTKGDSQSTITNTAKDITSNQNGTCVHGNEMCANESQRCVSEATMFSNGTGACANIAGADTKGIVRCDNGTESCLSESERDTLREDIPSVCSSAQNKCIYNNRGVHSATVDESDAKRDCCTTQKKGHGRLMFFLSNFLKTKYYRIVTSLPAKIIIPIFFVALLAVFLAFAVQLKPDERQIQMFRSSHNYGRAQNLKAYAFGTTSPEDLTRVKLVWGLQESNMSECNNKSSEPCDGTPAFDPKFQFGSPETQEAILGFCRRLKNLTDEQLDSLRVRRNVYTKKPEIACFMDAAQEFFWAEAKKKDYYGKQFYPANVTFDFPFTDDDLKILISANAKVFSVLETLNFTRPLEVALGYWLSKGWTQLASTDYYMYRNLIGEVTLNETRAFRNQRALSYNTGIKYIAIEINTTMYANTLGFPEGLPIYDRWEALMKEYVKDLPEPLSRGFQLTEDTWHWIRIQKTLANSAVYGVTIGLALALPILIITTQNVVIGFLATITIALITVCVVGMIPMASWRLGVLESLNLCLVVGLSVDYVVHLAEAYHRCKYNGRGDRVRYMLETVGTAVLSGAITTSGAAIFMLFAEIQFLLQFGIFMLATIGFSILFALLGFPVLMVLCGPQGNTGSLTALCTLCKKCHRRREMSGTVEEINSGAFRSFSQ